jgi:hypothetical protein
MPDASETNPYDAGWREDSEGRQFYSDPFGNTWLRDPDDPDTLHRVDAHGNTFTRTPEGREIAHGPAVTIDQNAFTSPDGRTLTRVMNGHMFRSGPDGHFIRYTGEVAKRDPAKGEWHAVSDEAFDQAVEWNRELERILSTESGRAGLRHLSGLLDLGAAGGLQAYMLGKIATGALESIAGLAEFVWSISPTRALIDPEGWTATMEQLGRGLRYAIDHPGAILKAVVDWDTWAEDPLRAIGHMLPGALATIATAGSAKVATSIDGMAGAAGKAAGEAAGAARAAGKVADDVAELRRASAASGDGVPSGFSPAGKGWLRRELGINIDEPLAPGEPGISPQEAMRRATDLHNRQLLDSLTNQATKREAVHVPIAPRKSRAVVSVVDKPSAVIDRPLGEVKEWRELSEIILEKKARALAGKTPDQARDLLNRALRDELKDPRTAPGRLLSAALEGLLGKDASDLFRSRTLAREEWSRPGQKQRGTKKMAPPRDGGGPVDSTRTAESAIADEHPGEDPRIPFHRNNHSHSEGSVARPRADSREPGRQPSAAVSSDPAAEARGAGRGGAAHGDPARTGAPAHPAPAAEPSTGRAEPGTPTSPAPGRPVDTTSLPDSRGVPDGRSGDPGATELGGPTGPPRGAASHVTSGEAPHEPTGSRPPEPSGAESQRPAPDASRAEKPSPEDKPHSAPRHTAPPRDRDENHRQSSTKPDPSGRTDAPPGPSDSGPPAAPPVGYVDVITPRGVVRIPIDGSQPAPDFKKWDETEKPPAEGEPDRPPDKGAGNSKDDTDPHNSQAALGQQPSGAESTACADHGAGRAHVAPDVTSGAPLHGSGGLDPMDPLSSGAGSSRGVDAATGYDPMDPLGFGAGSSGATDPATGYDPMDPLGFGAGSSGATDPATGYDPMDPLGFGAGSSGATGPATGYDPMDPLGFGAGSSGATDPATGTEPMDLFGAGGGLAEPGVGNPATGYDPLDMLGAAGGSLAHGGLDPATGYDPRDVFTGLGASAGWNPDVGHDPICGLGGGAGGSPDAWVGHDPTGGAMSPRSPDGIELPSPGAPGVDAGVLGGLGPMSPGGGSGPFDPGADPLGGSGSRSDA